MLIIIKNNDDPEEYDDDEEIYEYHVISTMKKTRNIALSKHSQLHPDMQILLMIHYSPNPINLWNRIRDSMGKTKIKIIGSRFNLRDGYSERMMIKRIMQIHNERLEYDD